MKLMITIVMLLCLCNSANSQIIYDQATLDSITQKLIFKPTVLVDSLSNHIVVLDSSHIFLSCSDKKNNLLWHIDPFTDDKQKGIRPYRLERPLIVAMWFADWDGATDKSKKRVLVIVYNDTRAAHLDLKTGEYVFFSED